ncbi:hypothetical protein V6N12_007517 [Hibiscus sabdariffa]|uniref:Uncharacterized protein n=1 Tax=Hibiscus sabdariffa TaxID=183260 RepID=A0ABR2F208_9ROSI
MQVTVISLVGMPSVLHFLLELVKAMELIDELEDYDIHYLTPFRHNLLLQRFRPTPRMGCIGLECQNKAAGLARSIDPAESAFINN